MKHIRLDGLVSVWSLISVAILGFILGTLGYAEVSTAIFLLVVVLAGAREFLRRKNEKEHLFQRDRKQHDFLVKNLAELRRPLQGLVGIRDIYTMNLDDPDTKEYVDVVSECSEHLVRHLDRMQLLSEIEGGYFSPRPQRLSLVHLLDDAISLAEIRNTGKTLQFSKNFGPGTDRDFFGEYELLRTMLVEVLDNAVKYSPRGHVDIEIQLAGRDNQTLHIAVQDSGPGVSRSLLGKLQTELNISVKENLGISLIRNIAKVLNAKIDVSSEVGKGTTFSVKTPISEYSQSSTAAVKSNLASHHVLIVDDEPISRDVIAGMLQKLGIEADISASGYDAIELCRRKSYGLVLMDLGMPVVDGYAATESILKNPSARKKPVIVALSSLSKNQEFSKIEKFGFYDYIEKPASLENLRSLLGRLGLLPEKPAKKSRLQTPGGTEGLFNYDQFTMFYDSDPELCGRVLSTSLETLPGIINDVKSSAEKTDHQRLLSHLHSLTGALRALRVEQLDVIIESIETEPDMTSPRFQLDMKTLTEEVHRLIRELSAIVHGPTETPNLN